MHFGLRQSYEPWVERVFDVRNELLKLIMRAAGEVTLQSNNSSQLDDTVASIRALGEIVDVLEAGG